MYLVRSMRFQILKRRIAPDKGVQDLVARGVDGILISPIGAVATRPAFAAAKEAGIPIMSIARHANTPDQTLFIAMDEVAISQDISGWLIDAIGVRGKSCPLSEFSGILGCFRNGGSGSLSVSV